MIFQCTQIRSHKATNLRSQRPALSSYSQPDEGDRLLDLVRLIRLCLSRVRWESCDRLAPALAQLWLRVEAVRSSRRVPVTTIDRANVIDLIYRICWIKPDLQDWLLEDTQLSEAVLTAEIS